MLISWQTKIVVLILAFFVGFWKGCEYKAGAHDLYVAKMEADSEKLLNGVLQRNALLKAKYDADAKERDKSYESKIAAIRSRANAANGVRLFDPGKGCGDTGQTGKDSTGDSKDASTGRELSGKLTQFLVTEATRADEVKAYADTCYAWANFK